MPSKIRVKLLSKYQRIEKALRHPEFTHKNIDWVLDKDATDYDWFVVYDDLPPIGGERLSLRVEDLQCPQNRTILLTYEPSSVKFYGRDYVNQFGTVLTSHEPEILKHPNRHFVPPVGIWYYGTIDHVKAHPTPSKKTADLSMFMSFKAQKHTMHHLRASFMQALADRLGDQVDLFGRDLKFVEHKAEGTDNYRYQIAVENHVAPHHWTEKLTDAYLGYCLPFYFGCPNVSDYFPAESFIALDIKDVEGSVDIIQQAIANNEYEKRLDAIIEARRRVVEDHNIHTMLATYILDRPEPEHRGNGKILSRHAMMRRDIPTFLRYAFDKTSHRRRNKKYFKKNF